jgi:Secretion system C-terminal sorting domain
MIAFHRVYLALPILIMPFGQDLQAQTGPGGVGNKLGTSNLKIWYNADAITDVTDGNNITTWKDISGNNIHASQSTSLNKPNFEKGIINGFSAVTFQGAREYLDGSYGSTFQAPISVFTAGFFSQANQGNDDDDFIFSVGSTSASGYNRMSVGRAKLNNAGGNADKFINTETDVSFRYGSMITGGQWVITGQIFQTSSPYLTAYLDGALMTMSGDYSSKLLNEGNFSVGRYRNGAAIDKLYMLNGYVGDIIVYDKVVNDAERNLITAYLAAKYDKTISGDVYAGDNLGNGDHDRDVAGVGKESNGSNTSAYSASLYISSNSNFDNGDYLVAGHNVIMNSVNTTDTDLGSFQGRWDRVWYFDVTDAGSALTANLSFDLNDSGLGGSFGVPSNYRLIYRSGTSGAWSNTGATATIAGNKVYFSNVSFTSGDGYYTLATTDIINSPIGTNSISISNDGPGGIGATDGSSNLKLWLDASLIKGASGDALLTWPDQSGNGYNATNNAGGTEFPLLKTGSDANNPNGLNFINFSTNTGSSYFSGSLTNLDAPATIIAVPWFANANQPGSDRDYVFRVGTTGTVNQHSSITRGLNGSASNNYVAWDGANARQGVALAGTAYHIITQHLNTSADLTNYPYHDMFLNGKRNAPTTFTSALNTDGTYEIGRFAGSSNQLTGNLAEIIVFDKTLNAAEINIIHSYLSAKYAIALDGTGHGDKYAGDDGSNGDYDFNVAGVGLSAAISGAAAGSNIMASSSGLKMTINSNFQDGDYVLFGNKAQSNPQNTTDILCDDPLLEARWERIWYFDITDAGAGLTVDILFDFSSAGITALVPADLSSNYKLLYRAGQTGSWSVIGSGSTYNGDQVTFDNVALIADGYYTLGSIDISLSPLPLELISFTSSTKPQGVLLKWVTASEVNFDHFQVERSFNGREFHSIGDISAKGGKFETHYQFIDDEVIGDKIYYRLKMIDLDQSFEYSGVTASSFSREIMVFPNPMEDYVNITLEAESEAYLQIIDQMGHIYYSDSIKTHQHCKITVDVRDLQKGVYILKIIDDGGKSHICKLVKK